MRNENGGGTSFPSKWWTSVNLWTQEPENGGSIFYCRAYDFYHLQRGYILSVVCSENHLHFFSTVWSIKGGSLLSSQCTELAEAWIFQQLSPSLSLPFSPFLSLSLFSCRFSRYAAKTKSSLAACERAELLPPECQQLLELHPEFKEEINRWINKWTEISCLSICTQTRFLEQACGSCLYGILVH